MAEYTTREMIDAIEINPPVRKFLTEKFFPIERTHLTEKVEFDVKKGRRIMALCFAQNWREGYYARRLPDKGVHYTQACTGKGAYRG